MYTLHPQPFQIFQLWQVYLDNVDPLLKATHTPSLQKRIIEAAANVLTIKPELEALMFGIYCMAITSLAEDGCQAIFGLSRVELLAKFQLGCQQALLNSRFMRSTNRDCLTALYFYLVGILGHMCSLFLTIIGLGQAHHSASVSVPYAWYCNSYWATYGHS